MEQKSDAIVRCVDCGEQFTITTSEMEWWHRKGLHLPKRCRKCREQRKTEGSAKREGPAGGNRDSND